MVENDTIVAIATAPGVGGVGVVRVSGPAVPEVAMGLVGKLPVPRSATLATFAASNGQAIDQGLALYFEAPRSYTGEHVLELHGHGGRAVMALLVRRCTELGARLAVPGEFTQRAFLNGKLDLAQAEAVADIIEAASTEGVLSAARSMVGEFSDGINAIVETLIRVRMHVEACIDFPEEEIETSDLAAIKDQLGSIRKALADLRVAAGRGAVLRDGLTVALIGRPNVGKSSLLNRMARQDLAIVTPIPGTTRDLVRATILLSGVPIHLIDTAGLRDTDDEVERLGIERTWRAVDEAGAALLLTEADEGVGIEEAKILARLPKGLPMAWVRNKIDLLGWHAGTREEGGQASFRISALTGEGVNALEEWLLGAAGWRPGGEGVFMARARHLVALDAAIEAISYARVEGKAFEVVAEDLRLAQQALGGITGEFGADDLLGQIFGSFCIGK